VSVVAPGLGREELGQPTDRRNVMPTQRLNRRPVLKRGSTVGGGLVGLLGPGPNVLRQKVWKS